MILGVQHSSIPLINMGASVKKKFERSLLNVSKYLWLWGNPDAGNTKGFLAHQQKSASFGDDFSNDQETLLPLSENLSD